LNYSFSPKSVGSKLNKSIFFKNIATLIGGTGLSQVLPFIVAPIVARLYYPEDYALLASYTAITILFTIISTGMYSHAIVIDKTDESAINTAGAAILITAGITFIAILIILFFKHSIEELISNENILFWLFLVPFTIFFTGVYETLDMWNNRKKRFRRISGNKIFQTVITSGTTILLGFLGYHKSGLLISLIMGQAFAATLLFIQTLNEDKVLVKYLSISQIKQSFVRHKDFPRYSMPQGFLDGIRNSSLVFIISNFYGAAILGSYSFAMRLLQRPISVIGTSIGRVYYQKAAEDINKGKEIWGFTKKIMISLVIFALPFVLTLFFFADDIFKLVFSERWLQAGEFTQILIFWLFITFISSSFTTIPLIFKKQKDFFYFGLFRNFLPIFVLILCGIFSFIFIKTLWLFVLTNLLTSILILNWFILLAKNKINSHQ